jgi:hypothetical protein
MIMAAYHPFYLRLGWYAISYLIDQPVGNWILSVMLSGAKHPRTDASKGIIAGILHFVQNDRLYEV